MIFKFNYNLNKLVIAFLIIITIYLVLKLTRSQNKEDFAVKVYDIKMEFKGLNVRQNNFMKIFINGIKSYNYSNLIENYIDEKNVEIKLNDNEISKVSLNFNNKNQAFSKKFINDIEQLKYNIINIPNSSIAEQEQRDLKELKLRNFSINIYLNSNKVIKCYRIGCHH